MNQPWIVRNQPADVTEKLTDRGLRSICGIFGLLFVLVLCLAEVLAVGLADIIIAIHGHGIAPLLDE